MSRRAEAMRYMHGDKAALADRIERLTPDEAVNPESFLPLQLASAVWRWVGIPDHPRWTFEDDWGVWWWGNSRTDSDWDRQGPAYLTSWDAALSLVPIASYIDIRQTSSAFLVAVSPNATAVSWSAPLAITTAAIRARL